MSAAQQLLSRTWARVKTNREQTYSVAGGHAAIGLIALLAGASTLHQSAPGARRTKPIPVRQDLEQSGDGYPVFRIPALAVTRRGTLIAAYDGRPSMVDLPSHIAVLVRRSTDGGKTWRARQVVRSDSGAAGFSDASLLVDRTTGRIFLFYAAAMHQGFIGAKTGNNDDDPEVLQADCSWSDDDGVTWQHRRLTAAIKDPAWGGLFAASGAGIQLQHGRYAGRLLQQYVIRSGGQNYGASAWSDDHGHTWRMGALVGPGVDENKAVELSDGRILLNSRAKGYRKSAISIDGGVTWTGLHDEPQLVDPGNNGSVVRYDLEAPASDLRSRWLLFSNTADANNRVNLTVKLSCDDGATWPVHHTFEPGAAGYSTLAVLPDGTVGMLYERGAYAYITFTIFTLRDLGGGCG